MFFTEPQEISFISKEEVQYTPQELVSMNGIPEIVGRHPGDGDKPTFKDLI